MVGTPEPLTPVEDRVLQEPYLKHIERGSLYMPK